MAGDSSGVFTRFHNISQISRRDAAQRRQMSCAFQRLGVVN
jgi:hypothetical protein